MGNVLEPDSYFAAGCPELSCPNWLPSSVKTNVHAQRSLFSFAFGRCNMWQTWERTALPMGNACGLGNNSYLYFLVKMQTRDVWANFLALSWTSPGLLWVFSLHQQMCQLWCCLAVWASCGLGWWALSCYHDGNWNERGTLVWTLSQVSIRYHSKLN